MSVTAPLVAGINEVVFKGAASSYQDFGGPLVIMNYIVNNMEPAQATVSWKVVSDLGKAVIGDKAWGTLLFTDVPILRLFKDTAKEVIP